MFNLLVSASGWAPNRDTMLLSRTLNYTRDDLKERFQPGGVPDFTALMRLPTLFMEEGRNSEVAHVGTIARAQIIGRDIQLEYFYDSDVPPLLNSDIVDMAKEFTMNDWEFGNTHWAVKDVDLFRVLLRNTKPRRLQPTLFRIAEFESIEDGLVSVMMPFDSSFDAVYRTLQGTAVAVGMGFDAMTGALLKIDIRGAPAAKRSRRSGARARRRISALASLASQSLHHHRAGQPLSADQHAAIDRATR
jgi:hypothetical protein